MKNSNIIFSLFLFLGLQVNAQSLCSSKEKVYFSCLTEKGKVLSICGSRDLSNKGGYLLYRFGQVGNVELEFPKAKASSAKKFFYASYSRFQTSYTTLSFKNNGFTYSIFDRYEGDQSENNDEQPMISYGVQVTSRDGKETTIDCQPPVISELQKLEGLTSCDPHDAMNMGSCPGR